MPVLAVNTVEVTGEGCAPIYANIATSRDEALREAKRDAVEKALGVYVKGETQVENFVLSYHKVLVNSAGYIQSSEVIRDSERKTEDLYCLSIKANVIVDTALKDLLNDVQSMCYLQETMNQPRIMIVMTEEMRGRVQRSSVAEAMLGKALTERCFNLVDKAQVDEIIGKDLMKNIASGEDEIKSVDDLDNIDLRPIIDIMIQSQTDWLLIGSARSDRDSCVDYETAKACQASINIKMINAESGQVMTSISEDGGDYSATAQIASERALKKACDKAVLYILEQVVDNWKIGPGGSGACRSVTISITGADFEEFNTIKNYFKNEVRESCNSVSVLQFSSKGLSKIDARMKISGQELAEYMLEYPIADVPVSVESFTQNRIDLKVK